MEYIEVDEIKIELKISRGKKLRMTISPKTAIPALHIPQGFSETKALQFARENIGWVKKHRIQIKQRIADKAEKQIIKNGSIIRLWGYEYGVKIIKGGKILRFSIDDNFFYIKEPQAISEQEALKKRLSALNKLYKQELQLFIEEILPRWEKTVKESPDIIKYRDMKSKWGSCNITEKIITLNIKLAEKSEECAEMVLVHELIHFKERLHNTRFKHYMTKFLPDWKNRVKILNSRTELD